MSFDPFGARREMPWTTAAEAASSGFTGHEHDDAVGLINMQGRLYDPWIRRFVSADPFVAAPFGQGLNRYSYVLNSPMTYSDPTGYQPVRVGPYLVSDEHDSEGRVSGYVFQLAPNSRGRASGPANGSEPAQQAAADDYRGTTPGASLSDILAEAGNAAGWVDVGGGVIRQVAGHAALGHARRARSERVYARRTLAQLNEAVRNREYYDPGDGRTPRLRARDRRRILELDWRLGELTQDANEARGAASRARTAARWAGRAGTAGDVAGALVNTYQGVDAHARGAHLDALESDLGAVMDVVGIIPNRYTQALDLGYDVGGAEDELLGTAAGRNGGLYANAFTNLGRNVDVELTTRLEVNPVRQYFGPALEQLGWIDPVGDAPHTRTLGWMIADLLDGPTRRSTD
jgi:RHS repeat-associated protein